MSIKNIGLSWTGFENFQQLILVAFIEVPKSLTLKAPITSCLQGEKHIYDSCEEGWQFLMHTFVSRDIPSFFLNMLSKISLCAARNSLFGLHTSQRYITLSFFNENLNSDSLSFP